MVEVLKSLHLGLATAALLLPIPRYEHRRLSVFVGFAGKKESRRGDSNPWPAPATSDNSGVAGACTDLQMPHTKADFLSPVCPVLQRIAFSVVSEWCQKSVDQVSLIPLQAKCAREQALPEPTSNLYAGCWT